VVSVDTVELSESQFGERSSLLDRQGEASTNTGTEEAANDVGGGQDHAAAIGFVQWCMEVLDDGLGTARGWFNV